MVSIAFGSEGGEGGGEGEEEEEEEEERRGEEEKSNNPNLKGGEHVVVRLTRISRDLGEKWPHCISACLELSLADKT